MEQPLKNLRLKQPFTIYDFKIKYMPKIIEITEAKKELLKSGYKLDDTFKFFKVAELMAEWKVKNCSIPADISDLLEDASNLVGNPGTNISGSTDIACLRWQEKYERIIVNRK